MNIRCKNCEAQGNIEKCLATNCDQHDSWIVLELKKCINLFIIDFDILNTGMIEDNENNAVKVFCEQINKEQDNV